MPIRESFPWTNPSARARLRLSVDPRLKARIAAVTAKRPRTVLDHILKHGKITTDELKQIYGYSHPPRAARDVREQGIPLLTHTEIGRDGRQMAVYTIDENGVVDSAKAGRRAFPKALKATLLARDGEQCALCNGHFAGPALQIDHRIPFEVAGENSTTEPFAFMLVCASCNRAKSWSCEHCPNWTLKSASTCATCLWSSPLEYMHVATEARRRLTIVWEGTEVEYYDRLAEGTAADELVAKVKAIIMQILRPKG